MNRDKLKELKLKDQQSNISYFRNIFCYEEESNEWKEAIQQFPNQVPRFTNKKDAIEFTKKHCKVSSNPDAPQLHHR
jgi:hypothetical protein